MSEIPLRKVLYFHAALMDLKAKILRHEVNDGRDNIILKLMEKSGIEVKQVPLICQLWQLTLNNTGNVLERNSQVAQEPICQCKSHRRLSFTLWVGEIPLEEEMAARSSVLAGIIPAWRAPSMGSRRVGHR